jgi:hypothetical protein
MSDEVNKTFTWGDLKSFVNSLPENELSKRVVGWQESESLIIDSAHQLEEDYLFSKEYSEDGCVPRSELKNLEGTEKDYTVVYEEGTPILGVRF